MASARARSSAFLASRSRTLALESLEDRVMLSTSALEAFLQQPLAFEANVGQTDAQVRFLARGQGYGLFLTGEGAVLNLYDPQTPDDLGTVLQVQLVGGNTSAPAQGLEQQPGQANYYIGNDPAAWRTGVARYGRVEYAGVYPGIDLVYYGTQQQQLEYDFIVAPGADPSIIKLAYEGADSIEIDDGGNLVLHTSHGDVVQHAPVVYQEIGGQRHSVNGAFTLSGNQVGFWLGDYDAALPLVIDPVLIYSSYLGGSGVDDALDVALDYAGGGSIYVTGFTRSANFPLNGASDNSLGGPSDAFVSRFGSAGGFIYSTYLGGSGRENDFSVIGGHGAVAGGGNYAAYVTGYTQSSNFPLLGALDSSLGGTQDAFFATFNSGGVLTFSTYVGGAGVDAGTGIALDNFGAGGSVITGWTSSTDFPTQNAWQPAPGGGVDAFVLKVNGTRTGLLYSSYLGGTGDDLALDVAQDAANNSYVTGRTQSANFPTTGGLDGTLGGSADAFVAKWGPSGSLVFSTFLGGSGDEDLEPAHNTAIGSLAVDALDNVYITGSTSSADFPVFGAFDTTLGGAWDAYVTKLDSAGTTVYATYLGGAGNDVGMGIATDAMFNAFITGYTESADFPTVLFLQGALAGSRDAYLTVLNSLGIAPIVSTYLGGPGGSEGDIGRALMVDNQHRVYLVGFTDSTAFPTQAPRQGTPGGSGDGFVARLGIIPGATLAANGVQTYAPAIPVDSRATENGPTDRLNVNLNAPPTANVFLTLTPDSQLAVSPSVLTFTPANWDTIQQVTITAVDDVLVEITPHDGVITLSSTSVDPAYNALGYPSVSARITDNDTPGGTWGNPISALSETGPASDVYTVYLTSTPAANVVVTIDAGPQGTIAPGTLTFTPANWYLSQRVTITAVDDALVEGPHQGTITHIASSADPNYNGLSLFTRNFNVIDNDLPAIVVTDTNRGTDVTEGGPTDVYMLRLLTPPAADVTVTPDVTTQLAFSPGSLVFTSANWNTPQTVTVTAVDDGLVESAYPGWHAGAITHTVTSADVNYNNLAVTAFNARITDNDTVGVYQDATTAAVTEVGPSTDTFTVVLTSIPTANVFVSLTSGSQVSVAPIVLTFTPANWFAIQTVNVTAVDDGLIEGTHTGVVSALVTSTDAAYSSQTLTDVTATITDNDSAGIFILETFASTAVSEVGPTSDSYSIRLLSQPTANVVVTLNPGTQLALSATILTFTPAAWNTPQTVTVTAVNDAIAEAATHDGIIAHTSTSTDTNYNGVALSSLTVSIVDNDTAGITLSESGGSTSLAEGGALDTYVITLSSQPTANVIVTLNPDGQVSVTPGPLLTFDAANWNVPQTVTIMAVDDFMVEVSPHQGVVSHTVSSVDPFYSGQALPGVTANITDNDVGGVAVTQTGGNTDVTEGLGSDTYTIVLSSAPSASVVITLNAGAQVTVSTTRLTFTSANWNVQQTVTVTAVDDAIFEGPHTGVITHTPGSADPVYNGISIGAVTADITDNDAVGILQSGGSTSVAEVGGTDTYTLVLASMPTANVVITFNPGSQLAVAPAPVTFTPASWNVAQTVTVSAVNDLVAEGSHSGVIRHTATSADANYNGVVIVDVSAQIADDDIAGATLTATGGATDVTEGMGSDSYDIVLNTQPTANVSISLTPDTGLVAAPTLLVFTPANWNVPQIVTVTAPDDGIQQGPRTRFISHAVSSSDPFYQPVVVASLPVNLLDPPGVTITATNGTNAVIEGAAQSYTVRLNTAPTAPVTIDLTGDSQVAVAPSQVVFGPSDWNVPRPIVVTAVDDSAVEGAHAGNLNFTVASADPTYSSLAVSGFAVSVIDNDGTPVIGTNRADQIVVTFDVARILVSINSQLTTLPITLSQLVVQGGDGNDNIQVVSPTVPVVVISGRGTDKVFATGQNGANTFVLDNGSVLVNGVGVQVWETESLIVNGRADNDTFSVNGVPGFAVEFKGEAGNDQVIGGNRANTWQITGPATGTFNRTIKLNGVENWTGGSLGDTFVFGAGKALGGVIDGGGGSDVLDYSASTAAVSVNLETSAATGTKGFANIARVVGGKNGADRLIGPNQILTWNITGANAGSVGGIAFQGFENLTGGALDDTFHFANGQSVRGKIDGGAGLDHLDYSAFVSKAVVINLQTKTATNTAGFLNIEQFTGGGSTMLDTLIGANVNNTWTLTDRGAGSVASPLSTLPSPLLFAGFENFTGGSLIDTFALTTALSDWLGTLNGGSGKDVLTAFQGQLNLYTNTALNAGSLNGRKFLNVESRR